MSVCHKKIYAGIQSANALVSGSGSDIPLIQDNEPSNSSAGLSMPHKDFLAWLSSPTLKIFILGVSSQILPTN